MSLLDNSSSCGLMFVEKSIIRLFILQVDIVKIFIKKSIYFNSLSIWTSFNHSSIHQEFLQLSLDSAKNLILILFNLIFWIILNGLPSQQSFVSMLIISERKVIVVCQGFLCILCLVTGIRKRTPLSVIFHEFYTNYPIICVVSFC